MAIHMQKQQQHPEEPNSIKYVKLFTETTANAIYIQPLDTLALSDKGAVRTFLYAFKQAIEDVFQIEGSENRSRCKWEMKKVPQSSHLRKIRRFIRCTGTLSIRACILSRSSKTSL